MRTATILAWGQIDWWPGNLFRGWRPCICLTLKLLSLLWLVVRDCVFIPPPPTLAKESAGKQRHPCMCFSLWCGFLSECAFVWCCVLLCVCAHVCLMEGWRENAGEGESANPYSLWRIQGHSFMFCQPSVNQFPIKVLLNSAVIPIPVSRFSPHCFSCVLSILLVFPLICCSVSNMSCQCQSGPVRLSNDTS